MPATTVACCAAEESGKWSSHVVCLPRITSSPSSRHTFPLESQWSDDRRTGDSNEVHSLQRRDESTTAPSTWVGTVITCCWTPCRPGCANSAARRISRGERWQPFMRRPGCSTGRCAGLLRTRSPATGDRVRSGASERSGPPRGNRTASAGPTRSARKWFGASPSSYPRDASSFSMADESSG